VIGRLAVAVLLVALALAAPSRAALADSPTAGLIPNPSSSSWQLDQDSSGPLTASDIYGAKAGSIKGFVDSYMKFWTQPGEILFDRLDRFSSVVWSAFRFDQSKAADQKDKAHTSFKSVSRFGEGACEVTYPADSDGFKTDVLVFTQGDYFAVILIAAKDATPDHSVLMDQAGRQLDQIPIPISEYNSIGRVMQSAITGASLLFLVVAVVTAVVIFYVVRSRPSRNDRAPMMATHLSPDGRYWWDGTTWRPVPPG